MSRNATVRSRILINATQDRFDALRVELHSGNVEHVADFTFLDSLGWYRTVETPAVQRDGVWYIIHPETGDLTGLISDRKGRYPVRSIALAEVA